ncbi:hypothetical protein A5645_11080 [Mycobacterium asiaticum]|uniref:DUF2510 domain-containing protein n=1 Tax=Mycobacterium asiaticum TaxID=1790 RepID=UPI0007EF0FAC|nr:DUF2510 domain-containing protein [Mycobacterium asiaticum]OBK95769.1 hypothetical protein A5645_11080 [Mycobacterium asiaticum]
MASPMPAPGWYPDPSDPTRQIYWDGSTWIKPGGAGDSDNRKNPAIAIGVCVLVGIGLVMSMQSVSLMTGSGQVWTGVAVVAGGTALAFILRTATWVRVVSALLLALALANALYIEDQLSKKRDELTHIFNNNR